MFLVWLASGLVVLFVISAWRRLKERWAMVVMGLITVVADLGLQMVNVDAMIARGAEHQEYKELLIVCGYLGRRARTTRALARRLAETHQLLQRTHFEWKPTSTARRPTSSHCSSFAEHPNKEPKRMKMKQRCWADGTFWVSGGKEAFLWRCKRLASDHRQPCSNQPLTFWSNKKKRGWQFYSPTKQATYDQIVKSDQLESGILASRIE